MFKKKRSIHLPYEVQGYIQFLCYTLERQKDKTLKKQIQVLCREIAGGDWKILYEVLTNKYKTLESVSRDNFISERRLSLWRACFFETYAKRILN